MASATRELLAERYHLEERIATGGMGVVWRARDHRLGRDVAIKLIRPEYADDPTFRQRLQSEARAIASINSPHVVRIHDVCEERDPAGGCRAFLVMELVDGQPLSAILRAGPLGVRRTADVIAQAAAALAAAHAQEVVHRDIKPANLMLDRADRVTVLDFGISRAADAVALTATGLLLGTARYVSPEQADGRGATAASDVYSLGVVAFECLAGGPPFDADSDVAIALAHLRNPVPQLPANVPAPVASLVRQMLAKSPQERPSAQEVADRLGAVAAMQTATRAGGATIVLPDVPAASAAPHPTAVMPVMMAARHRMFDRLAGRDLKETRSAALRPRMLAIPTAAIALILLIVAAAAGGSGGVAKAADRTHARHHAVAKVNVDPTLYVGQQWPMVRDALRGLGLDPVARFASAEPGGAVLGLAPTGKVAKGAVVTVVVAKTSRQPKPKPKPPAPAHVPPGQAKKAHGGPGKHGGHGD